MSVARARLFFAVFGASVAAAAACGARTGLPVPTPPPDTVDAGDAGPDVEDAPDDAPDVIDAPVDAPVDAPMVVTDCVDAGVTYIYVITVQNELFAFYPPDQSLTYIGTIQCNDTGSPFSMAVDRKGIAYVVFNSGNLYRVSTLTASCEPTPYQVTTWGIAKDFGMGFSADIADPAEQLYIAGDVDQAPKPTPALLGTIDLTSFQIDTVGQFPFPIGSAELTGTGDGRLFGFGVDGTALSLLQIDKTTAGILSQAPLQLQPMGSPPPQVNDWAFAFWGGSFYFFTSTSAQQPPSSASTISRYDPANPSPVLEHVMDIPGVNIDGAGVSTCAPQQ